MNPLPLIIVGARGRMGQTLQACAARQPDLAVVGRIDQGDDLAAALDAAQVVVDFSLPDATETVVSLCAARRKALVLGTTGHDPAAKARIAQRQTEIPIVWSANYSTGVNALYWLSRKAAEILGPAFDLEIIEVHHRHKKDAPSGTAMTLAEILAAARQQSLPDVARHGRAGTVGERPPAEIGLHAVRGGDVVGDHTVLFAGPGERLELIHRASTRETLALGALRAARWVVHQPAGLYSMQDVLGLA